MEVLRVSDLVLVLQGTKRKQAQEWMDGGKNQHSLCVSAESQYLSTLLVDDLWSRNSTLVSCIMAIPFYSSRARLDGGMQLPECVCCLSIDRSEISEPLSTIARSKWILFFLFEKSQGWGMSLTE